LVKGKTIYILGHWIKKRGEGENKKSNDV